VIRPATHADEPFLLEMLELASNWRSPDPGAPRNPVDRAYAAGFGRPGDVGVIAEDESGRPAGAAWCRLRTSEDPGYGYVADDIPELTIAVSASHRGHGLATSLLQALKHAAAEAGFRALSLSVEPDNAARRIYERAGFGHRHTDTGGSHTMVAELP
jgi:ribosomal protein S18 acetylase RimI-like enzyme